MHLSCRLPCCVGSVLPLTQSSRRQQLSKGPGGWAAWMREASCCLFSNATKNLCHQEGRPPQPAPRYLPRPPV